VDTATQISDTQAGQPPRVLEFSRVFKAPRALVFALWTQPRHLIQWWGPRGFHVTQCEIDPRPDGSWRICFNSASTGEPVWTWGLYRQIDSPSKLIFSYSMDAYRYETVVTALFEELGDETLMRFRQEEFLSDENLRDHGQGWNSALDCMVDHIARLLGGETLLADLTAPHLRDGTAADFAAAAARADEEKHLFNQ
jgi:uncharacterized protein YndB with AHSA1/START domain